MRACSVVKNMPFIKQWFCFNDQRKPQAFETQLFFCFDFLVNRLDFLLDELEVFF